MYADHGQYHEIIQEINERRITNLIDEIVTTSRNPIIGSEGTEIIEHRSETGSITSNSSLSSTEYKRNIYDIIRFHRTLTHIILEDQKFEHEIDSQITSLVTRA